MIIELNPSSNIQAPPPSGKAIWLMQCLHMLIWSRLTKSHRLQGKGCADGERARRSCDSPRSSACGPCQDLSGGIKQKAGAQPSIPGGLAARGAAKTPEKRLPAPGTDGTAALLAGLPGAGQALGHGALCGVRGQEAAPAWPWPRH